jgi:hypothetical protein
MANRRPVLHPPDGQVVIDYENAEIEADVVVCAQTEDVARHVWAIVGPSQWPNMGALRVANPLVSLDDFSADLAHVFVRLLDAADDALICDFNARSRARNGL